MNVILYLILKKIFICFFWGPQSFTDIPFRTEATDMRFYYTQQKKNLRVKKIYARFSH